MADFELPAAEKTESELKHSRAGYLGNITKLYKEAEVLMVNRENCPKVTFIKSRINIAFERFEKAHHEYIHKVTDESELQQLTENLTSQLENKNEMIERIEGWINQASQPVDITYYSEKDPSLKSSSLRSSRTRSSRTSSSRSKYKDALIKQSIAELRSKQLMESQEMEKEKLELEHRVNVKKAKDKIKQLKLEAQLWKADSEPADRHTEHELNVDAKSWHGEVETHTQDISSPARVTSDIGGAAALSNTVFTSTNPGTRPRTTVSNTVTSLDQSAGLFCHTSKSQSSVVTSVVSLHSVINPIYTASVSMPCSASQVYTSGSQNPHTLNTSVLTGPSRPYSLQYPAGQSVLNSATGNVPWPPYTHYSLYDPCYNQQNNQNQSYGNYGMYGQSSVPQVQGYVPQVTTSSNLGRLSAVPETSSVSQGDVLQETVKHLALLSNSVTLPKPELLTFNGEAKDYFKFITNFETNVVNNIADPKLKLSYLIQFCVGEAKKLIEDCVLLSPEQGLKKAFDLLKCRYGKPHIIARSFIDGLTSGPNLGINDVQALVELSNEMNKCQMTLVQMGYTSDINSTVTISSIVKRLPNHIRAKWVEKAHSLLETNVEPNFAHLCRFIENRAQVASTMYGVEFANDSKSQYKPKVKKFETLRKGTTLATVTGNSGNAKSTITSSNSQMVLNNDAATGSSNLNKKCVHCQGNHFLIYCEKFKALPVQQRCEVVKRNKLCFNCTHYNHIAKGCKKTSQCKKCTGKHHDLLHLPTYTENREFTNVSNNSGEGHVSSSNVHCSSLASQTVSLRILPVCIKGSNDKFVETYALLDNGSDVSLCDKQLLEMLGIKGKQKSFNITTVNQTSVQNGSEVGLDVYSLDKKYNVRLSNVWSVDRLPITANSMPDENTVKKWPHLTGLTFSKIKSNDVMLLIGSDTPEVFWTMDERRGNKRDPYAVKSVLGWTLMGPTGENNHVNTHVNFQQTDALEQQLERMWKTDFNDSLASTKSEMSVNDKHAYEIMKSTVSLDDGHYMLALPWKSDPAHLPNNRRLAEIRLSHLKHKLSKDKVLFESYKATVEDYIRKGYARKLDSVKSKDSKFGVWYLPHHPVVNPNKPGKVRVVFDCAAKYSGISLNDQILQGPDLVNALVGVLLRFREHPIALVADIEAMFHQVKVVPSDENFLRFLWWTNGCIDTEPDVYCMTRHIFGATSSPRCASFALKQTSVDNEKFFNDEVISAVNRNFYVDDLLKSCCSIDSAITISAQLRILLEKGGFRLTKWLSNSKEVLNTIPESEKAPSVADVKLTDELPIERALGMKWNIELDKFSYYIKISDKPLTRRGLLSMTSSLYDPLGLVSPVTLMPKLLMQELCRNGYKWDEQLPDSVIQQWYDWTEALPAITEIDIPRWVKHADLSSDCITELHHFADASEYAYGAASYLKVYDLNGFVTCNLLMGKSRLAPLKAMTIPRLELSAAVVAVRLHQLVMTELDMKIHQSYFWTDSMSTLKCIQSRTKRFKTFVANRLAIIHEVTDPCQWRYISSQENPADFASRGIMPRESRKINVWLRGPEFLFNKTEFSDDTVSENSDLELEEKTKTVTNVATSEVEPNPVDKILHHFSSWDKLKKTVAWFIRYKRYLQSKNTGAPFCETGYLTVREIRYAETEIIKRVQCIVFSNDIKSLETTGCVKKSSTILKLCPTVKNGLLTVGGRLNNAVIQNQLKHPIILPNKHFVTKLIMRECHELNGHVGPHHVLTLLRQTYWIIKGLSAVKNIIGNCILCKKYLKSPECQQMAPMPKERVTPNKAPFSFVGVDYFGPLLVTQRRSQVKRYGCLFTCLTTRAVHIEIAHSLNTDSFLGAFTRFISRRGKPEIMYSDNGTNFKGGEKILKEEIENWNQGQIVGYCLQRNIEWKFIPPSASHMGGAWERMVKSVKAILKAVIKEQLISEETLHTVICEVEKILNDRPITKLSDDPKDSQPLTPNMLLLLQCNSSLPPGIFSKDDLHTRKWWRQAHYLADVFWKRWLKEYLPLLQTRSKWCFICRYLKAGDLVLVCNEICSRGQWPLGIVVETVASKDGLVRSAKVRFSNTVKLRPIAKLCLLEESD